MTALLLGSLVFSAGIGACTPQKKYPIPSRKGDKPRKHATAHKNKEQTPKSSPVPTGRLKIIGKWTLDTMIQSEKVVPSSILGTEYSLEFKQDGLCASKQSDEDKLFRYTVKEESLEMVGLNGVEKWQAKINILSEKFLSLTLFDEQGRLITLKFVRRP